MLVFWLLEFLPNRTVKTVLISILVEISVLLNVLHHSMNLSIQEMLKDVCLVHLNMDMSLIKLKQPVHALKDWHSVENQGCVFVYKQLKSQPLLSQQIPFKAPLL